MAKRKKHIIYKISIFLIILGILAGAIYLFGTMSYNLIINIQNDQENQDIYKDSLDEGFIFEIEKGTNTSDIAEKLLNEGIIENETMFRIWSKINGYDYQYKSGRHIISNDLNVVGLLGYDRLMRVLVSNPLANPEVKVLIKEGLTYTQIKNIFIDNKIIEDKRFEKYVDEIDFEYRFLELIPTREKKLEGYLFPETYRFPVPFNLSEKGSEEEVLQILLRQFNKIFKPEFYDRAEVLGMTVDEIITLASLIEREAMDPEEREIIAGVYYNRLKSNKEYLNYLQCDATIQYILLERDGKVKEDLLYEDLEIDHPYNTYLNKGLPPGPICNPGLASIVAALYPAEHSYYYYVAIGDGTHAFARTDAEHQSNIRKYQK